MYQGILNIHVSEVVNLQKLHAKFYVYKGKICIFQGEEFIRFKENNKLTTTTKKGLMHTHNCLNPDGKRTEKGFTSSKIDILILNVLMLQFSSDRY